jgi:hypothetical protein
MRVSEHGLHVGARERSDRRRAEAVTQVVEPDPAQLRAFERRVKPPAQGPMVEVLAECRAEHEIVVAGEVLAPAQPVQRTDELERERHAADPAALGSLLPAGDDDAEQGRGVRCVEQLVRRAHRPAFRQQLEVELDLVRPACAKRSGNSTSSWSPCRRAALLSDPGLLPASNFRATSPDRLSAS